MRLQQHLVASMAVSAATYAVSRSISMTVVSFVAGVLLDLDHGFDYLREYGLRLDVPFFFHSFHNTLYRRVVIPLHGWEWIVLLGMGAILTHGNMVLVGALIGTAQHLVFDQFTNGVRGPGYFFLYRAMKKFVASERFPGRGLSEK